jgi:hypothetical protein
MTLDEAQRKLDRLSGHVARPWTPAPMSAAAAAVAASAGLTETPAQKKVRLDREHQEKLRTLRKEREQKLSAIAAQHRENLSDWDDHRARERELAREKRLTEDSIKLAYRRNGREHRKYIGLGLDEKDKRDEAVDIAETTGRDKDLPDVKRLRAWVQEVCERERLEVIDSALPQLHNASAVRKLRRIIIAPMQSYETCIAAAHEAGHCLCPDEPADAKRVKDGLKEICVASELLAWQWVLANVPLWNQTLHAFMGQCIESYRSYATPDESAQIDRLVSRFTYAETRLRALRG